MLAPTSTTSPASYITIPISCGDVIFRSIQNLYSSISHCRPWPEFLSVGAGSLGLPSSFSTATFRLRKNCKYFTINYAIVISICAAASLIGAPAALIVIGFLYALWLVLYFFREDPMVIFGHHVDDRAVIVGLVLGSAAIIWFTGVLTNLLIGLTVGLLVMAIHGLLRNPEGLFLDESDAVFDGLISTPHQNGGIS